jgi:hypothetical protein
VAGGMGRKGDDFARETLAERVANTRARQIEHGAAGSTAAGHGTADFHGKRPNAPASWTAPPTVRPPPVAPPPRLKHCWYTGGPYGRQPALLLKWRCIEGHYDGLIVVVAPGEDGSGWFVVEMWVDAARLSPA